MANTAQCYYCFEVLSASFEGRKPGSLLAIEALWEQHEQAKKLAVLKAEEQQQQTPVIEEDDEDDGDDADDGGPESRPRVLKLPIVSSLRSQIPSDSSSSAATTPSITSNTSSDNSLLSNSTSVTTPLSVERRYPLFVTWNTLSTRYPGHKSLRGCIGTFEAQELAAGLRSYSLTSAFDDTRFSPITQSILPSLSCHLTLLGSFEPCAHAMDWTLGTHGLRISFIHRGRRYGATYLPDVPVEQGWTKEETVESLMRKAGWDGPSAGGGGGGSVARRLLRGTTGAGSTSSAANKPWDQVSEFRTVRYQGMGATADYAEWQEWRTWVSSLEGGLERLEMAR
ncbi:hypothetical protein N7474_009870 [Penicillium riverlandense]|uniref:uncharacterized protein n=1 Tax=Penicillium riverlandense TaxID=1903569 RepID=UPI0025477A66|nr:uncharacterized protein N7474_009870 [Penicillium riverlandense]KAJ5808601.1 hypothetical protein N7474_009870 [Penicillium riverlandense]